MTRHIRSRSSLVLTALLLTAAVGHADPGLPRGGVAVWIAYEEQDPTMWAGHLAAMHERNGRLVLGLHPDREAVAETRNELARLGAAGPIVVDHLRSCQPLPMIDDSVNLLITSIGIPIAEADILRVLAPGGAAQLLGGDKSRSIRKPWPDDIDEWPHYLHDTGNNAVADDDRVGPPRHLQWQAGPRWGRHHDHMSSVSAMVTSGGRVFSIIDEGSYLSPQLPADWQLVARDAFNGALLWKRPITKWQTHLWPLKSGPANLPRRLVAVDNTMLFTTLGIDAPVSILSAWSGETVHELPDSAGAEEILVTDETVLVLVNRTPINYAADAKVDPEESKSRDNRTTYSPEMGRIWSGIRSPRWSHGNRAILAYDRKDGRPLWQKPTKVIPLTLAADDAHVYYHNAEKIVALGLADGQESWTSEPVPVWDGIHGQGLQSWFAPTLVVHGGTVIFAGGEKTNMSYVGYATDDIGQDTMTALSAATGKKLWTAASPFSGYNSPEDVFVVQGKVWTGNTAKGGDGRYISYDLSTGELVDNFPPTLDVYWFHHRCYPAKATKNYILSSRAGIEFIDLASGQWSINHWVRGACLYGVMPANGLVYSPPHPCACYPEAKLYGFTALAAPRAESEKPKAEPAERLEKGPAYDASDLQSPVSSLATGPPIAPTTRAAAHPTQPSPQISSRVGPLDLAAV